MLQVKNIDAALFEKKFLENRTPLTQEYEINEAFATVIETNNLKVFVGSFSGQSAWERHINGDEFVQVLKGLAKVEIYNEGNKEMYEVKKGSITIFPKGIWHRFIVPDNVSILTLTPMPTEHFVGDTPGM